MATIYIVEVDINIREIERYALKNSGYEVEEFEGSASFFKRLEKNIPSLILLDIMLPGEDGLDILTRIRADKATADVPVIMVTAKTSELDKVKGLDLGADDYITKPFSISELIARVDAVCRRVNRSGSKPEEASQIVSGPFTLNLKSRTVFKNGEQIDLTQVEYQIMEYFFKNQNTALDRSSILNHIWGESYYGDDKIVDVNIRRIRMKIEDEPSNPKYILTIWGFGYKWAGGSN